MRALGAHLTTELRSGLHLESASMPPGDDTSQPNTSATTIKTTNYVALSQPRDPGIFYWTSDVDVDHWLRMYECISNNYGWDPAVMLENVIFYLDKDSSCLLRGP
ncbi:hypothetical protein HPB50_004016 [Hyalomma asiaticum]|uniref:Uncharacterized protein n=1 Tax=Hyalomma asiaticum TaxID=266040 RepID=A0ACB7RV90_HYAAI|nr:hypothetical protein HPB50_004016 [Hyalomma asiaticum]